MTVLPISKDLNINLFSQIFNKTTNSYKLLFFRALLDTCRDADAPNAIPFESLAIKSLSFAAYSIKYYKLSFGKTDQMTEWVNSFDFLNYSSFTNLTPYKIEKDFTKLKDDKNLKTYIRDYSKYVPYRLLAPFFQSALKGEKDYNRNVIILKLSNETDSHALYSLKMKENNLLITPNKKWFEYLKINYTIISGWLRTETVRYLQKNNPSVLSISSKLEPPIERNMSAVKREFEKLFIKRPDLKKCLYTNDSIDVISHDHFLPFSFFGSDPIYNFVPTSKSLNSSKSNSIPSFDHYFDMFSNFQWDFFNQLVKNEKSNNSLIEIQNDLKVEQNCDQSLFKERILDFYKPLYLSSKHQGFNQDWIAT